MLRVFEAFSGIGSQRMALNNIGIEHEVVAISEIEENSIKSYMAIHGDTLNLGDISKIKPSDIPKHDLFTYSFPCQDISLSSYNQKGLKENSGTRSSLLWECKKVIYHSKPKVLMLENVKNLISTRYINDFNKWVDWLAKLGYKNYCGVLNSKDYGLPQNRERVFLISILGEHNEFKFPEKVDMTIRLSDLMENNADEKLYLNEEQLDSLLYNRETDGTYANIKNATKKGYAVAKHGYGIDLSFPNSKTRRGRVQKDISNTVQTRVTNGVYDNGRIRKLSALEVWRLMGFKDSDYYKALDATNETSVYKQAGNSIAVPVLEGIFREIAKSINLID